MASKGLDFYAYVAKGFSIEIKKADAHSSDTTDHVHPGEDWQHKHFEINSAWLGMYYEGHFQFLVKKDGQSQPVFERNLRINSLNGIINSTDLDNILIPSIIGNDYCISFGLYDADAGMVSDLPNAHQLYVCVTENQSGWQQRLFEHYKKQKGELKNVYLKNLFLPGSHDAGMYLKGFPAPLSNFANTQKESITNQLQLGARYFDYRPGTLTAEKLKKYINDFEYIKYLPSSITDSIVKVIEPYQNELRHIHAVVPGEKYKNFLKEVIDFLHKNKQEIVVVKIKDSGFEGKIVTTPKKDELEKVLNDVLGPSTLKVGNKDSLGKSIQELIDTNERFVILYREDNISEYSTYNDDYGCYDANVIIESFKKLNKENVSNNDYIDVQLQLTAVNQTGAKVRAASGGNEATSPLRATKARTDLVTYKWLRQNLNFHNNEKLFVSCNDFYDNALTDTCYKINVKKLGL